MRQSNGVSYPDAVGYAFDVVLFQANGVDRMMIEMSTGNDILATFMQDAFDGDVYVDAREYVTSIMAGAVSVGVDYTQSMPSGLSVRIFYNIYTQTGGNTFVKVVDGAYTDFVWGALERGESMEDARRLTWWRGYPFCVDYLSSGAAVTLSGGGITQTETLPVGMARIPLYGFSAAKVVTFAHDGVTDIIDIKDCGEGAYLRWIDRQGRMCHWLFAKGDVTDEVTDDGEWQRNNLLTHDGDGWHGLDGRHGMKSRRQVLKVAAVGVDKSERRMLTDMASSPVVEVYDDGAWSAVRVAGGSWSRGKAALQDVEFDIIFDDVKLQVG